MPQVRASVVLACVVWSVFSFGCGTQVKPRPHLADSEPFVFEAQNVVNDGSSLHVLASIRSAVDYPSDQVMVRLSGYKDGALVRERREKLRSVMQSPSDRLLEGRDYSIRMSIPISGATDYQVAVLWGNDAANFVELEAQNQRLEGAACPSCVPVLSFELVNVGAKRASEATIAVSSSGPVDRIPENGEHMTVTELDLGPGERRSVQIELEGLETGKEPRVTVVGAR